MATVKMTRNEYLAQNDLLGAYQRFEDTISRWKDYWWEAVEEIFHKSAEWAQRFLLDPVERLLRRIPRKRSPALDAEKRLTYKVEAEGCGAYIVEHFNSNGERLWIKCGKANDVKQRLVQHFKVDYKGEAESGTVLGWFSCKNSNHALSMENVIRDYFETKGFALLGKDRFPTLSELTAEDVQILSQKAEILATLFQKFSQKGLTNNPFCDIIVSERKGTRNGTCSNG